MVLHRLGWNITTWIIYLHFKDHQPNFLSLAIPTIFCGHHITVNICVIDIHSIWNYLVSNFDICNITGLEMCYLICLLDQLIFKMHFDESKCFKCVLLLYILSSFTTCYTTRLQHGSHISISRTFLWATTTPISWEYSHSNYPCHPPLACIKSCQWPCDKDKLGATGTTQGHPLGPKVIRVLQSQVQFIDALHQN